MTSAAPCASPSNKRIIIRDGTTGVSGGVQIIRRILESYEPLGINVIDHQDGGVIVTDADGMFAPHMTTDLLSAIMKDHDIREIVSFSWSEDCDKHRINAFSGGGAVVSAEDARLFHVFDWIENAAREMREDLQTRPPGP
jgi:hypothetical protein